MDGFWSLNLIHFFNFYLGVMFLLSTFVRLSQYRAILSLVRAVPGRWPRLFQLVSQHKHVFLTWSTVLPAVLAFLLFAINLCASRLVWPQVDLTPGAMAQQPLALPFLLLLGGLMLAIDGYATFTVGQIDRVLMQQYFDQAEYWLRSWTAPVIRAFTLGYINPRQMVAVEVQKALIEASMLINSTLWWVITQTGLRVAFGLALWAMYGLKQLR